MTTSVPALIDEIARLSEHVECLETARADVARQLAELSAALAEALDLFDATWCPEWGHQPKPEQLARAAELRKLVPSS